MEALSRWVVEESTPVSWIAGPAGCGKTAAVEAVVGDAVRDAAVLRLSAFEPDLVLAEAGAMDPGERLTATGLLRFAATRRLVVLDGVDAIQQQEGERRGDITDSRFRQLLFAACERALPGTRVVVTSRLEPPSRLSSGSITVLRLPPARHAEPPSLPDVGTLERRVLEFAALGDRAIDALALQRMSGIDEGLAGRALGALAGAALMRRVGRGGYHVPAPVRAAALADPARAAAARHAAIDALRHDGSDPVRLLELLVDEGRVDEAVTVYWHDVGNFARLHATGRDHLGARLCHRLNGGLGPEEVSPALEASGGAWAVMNDWSQFARSTGDAATCARAAAATHDALPDDGPPWDAATVAVHAAEGALMAGQLAEAMRWCERGWEHAREGMRATQGVAVREVMEAYDWSSNTIAKIYLRLEEPAEIRRLLDDLSALHAHARRSVAEFDAGSILPLSGPSGDLVPEQLADGRIAAMLALAAGEPVPERALAANDASAVAQRELAVLRLRAEISAGHRRDAHALLGALRDDAERSDDCAAECELAVLAQRLTADATERLAAADAYLPRAAASGLGLQWRDLQLSRARALRDLGRRDEARRAAELALSATDDVAGALARGDWAAAREAVRLLDDLGAPVAEHVLAALSHATPPHRTSPPKPVERRAAASESQGATARTEMHSAALRVLEAYERDGTPFVLYFRHFDIEVLHGPFEFGPKLSENALRDALPADIEVVTVQDQSSSTYDLGSSRLRREAPALLLEDERWAEDVRGLIPYADLIVSEPLRLSPGVRIELQMIHDARRSDRTVLLLPPQQSPLATVDNDQLVQLFPRCLWLDALHREPLAASPVIADLLERTRAIAQLPAEARRALRDPAARDGAFPVSLEHVAEHLEREAMLGSVFGGDEAVTRYYAYWQLFRAVSIRGATYQRGDRSTTNRCRIAHAYLEMSKIMLDHTTEGDRVILEGDPAEAQQLVGSAYGLLQGIEDDLWADALRAQAEEQWEQLLTLERVLDANRDRFEIRARYGPLVKATRER